VPVNSKILFLVGMLGVIWILEAFDIGIIAPVLFILKNEWQLSPSSTGLIGSAGTLGIVIGLLPAGRLADRFGRKTTLIGGIVLFSIVMFLASFAHDATQLAIYRFVAGLGQGAVFGACQDAVELTAANEAAIAVHTGSMTNKVRPYSTSSAFSAPI
jgi:MFS transporter, putative metabolite:H+ symporter